MERLSKRIAFFTYGAVCYLIFLATFLYAMAFIGNRAKIRGQLSPIVPICM